ncbi:MAG: hypothetical protein R6V57_05190, partial [Vicinamibacterales bacterium]
DAQTSGGPMSIRPVKRLAKSQLAMEGAGVRLRRAFGFGDTTEVDPFLLFDDFRGDRPDGYLAKADARALHDKLGLGEPFHGTDGHGASGGLGV